MKHLGDIINPADILPHRLNLIATGCGTGKTYWATHILPHYWPDVKPGEILLATSRSLAAKQAAHDIGTEREYGEIDLDADHIHIMTYDVLGKMLRKEDFGQDSPLCHIKVVVVDEIHALMTDAYMYNNNLVKLWLKLLAAYSDVIVIGLTATPGVLTYYGWQVHQVNPEPLMRYKAKHLISTDWYSMLELIRTRLVGRTIIMCQSDKQCFELAKLLPNSFVLVSYANAANTAEMDWMRQYITENQMLPEADPDGVPIDFLIATSTAREGFTLLADSGVRNVISCICDDMHAVQFLGRIRGDVDNLIVVDAPSSIEGCYTLEYIRRSRELFRNHLAGRSNEWAKRLAYAIQEPPEQAEVYYGSGIGGRFSQYIDRKWLLPEGAPLRSMDYWIDTREKRAEIMEQAQQCGVFDGVRPQRRSFGKVEDWLVANGYDVVTKNLFADGRQGKRKVIVRAGRR